MAIGIYQHKQNQGFQKGHTIGKKNKGKKRSDKVKQEKSKAMKLLWEDSDYRKHMEEMHKGQLPWNTGKKRPEMMGDKHPRWRGGASSLRKRIRDCFEYRQWRSDIFTRDDFICQECGIKGVYLEAHHCHKRFVDILKEYEIETLEEALECEELWNINNGQTLCRDCHQLTK